ncbi:MAG TPA: glycosyltransferase family 4 protein [Gemmatimonadales bacterium]|nr:glycosyltransferase family 4 protein [Gemmatimonadales bacterium]
MVILHLLAPAAVGGLERVVQTLTSGLHSRGHAVHVAVGVEDSDRDPGRGLLAPQLTPGVAMHTIAVPRHGYGRERTSVTSLCRTLHPDVMHTHGYRPDVVDSGVARHEGIPVVSTVHGFTGGSWRMRVYERLQRLALRRCAAVAVVSQQLARVLVRSGVAVDRVHVIPNAWDGAAPLSRAAARRALGLPAEAFVVGWVGRLSAEKGPDVLLEALPVLRDLDFTVSMVGDGPLALSLRQERHLLGLDAVVRMHGAVPEAGRLFTAFDVFVLSSRTEGTPIVLFEAMAAGVPIIATAVGGVLDLLGPESAWLIGPDDPLKLAAALREVRAHPAVARVRSAIAYDRLRAEFRPEPWVQQYIGVYDRVRRRRPAVAAC